MILFFDHSLTKSSHFSLLSLHILCLYSSMVAQLKETQPTEIMINQLLPLCSECLVAW